MTVCLYVVHTVGHPIDWVCLLIRDTVHTTIAHYAAINGHAVTIVTNVVNTTIYRSTDPIKKGARPSKQF